MNNIIGGSRCRIKDCNKCIFGSINKCSYCKYCNHELIIKIQNCKICDSKEHLTQYCRIKNACVIFINMFNEILLVRDKHTKEWMIPGGMIDYGESAYDGALREFREETTFSISSINNKVHYYDNVHSNNSITRIYKIYGNITNINSFKPTNETDKVYFIKIIDLKRIIIDKILHPVVRNIKKHNLNSFKTLFKKYFLSKDNQDCIIN